MGNVFDMVSGDFSIMICFLLVLVVLVLMMWEKKVIYFLLVCLVIKFFFCWFMWFIWGMGRFLLLRMVMGILVKLRFIFFFWLFVFWDFLWRLGKGDGVVWYRGLSEWVSVGGLIGGWLVGVVIVMEEVFIDIERGCYVV